MSQFKHHSYCIFSVGKKNPRIDHWSGISPIMDSMQSKLCLSAALLVATTLFAQQPQAAAGASGRPGPKPQDTEVWSPEPKVVTPGATNSAPPSDAIVLFDGKNLDEWVQNRDKSPAKWTVADGVMTVNKAQGVGNIETK